MREAARARRDRLARVIDLVQIFLAVAGVSLAIAAPAVERLRVSSLTEPGRIPNALIVGRAFCLGASWVLTEKAQLVEISDDGRSVEVRQLSGLKPNEKVWGLGCLTDGSLWTLASARTVVRLDRGGWIEERIDLRVPRVALFGAGDRLLYQALPIRAGATVLATSPPRQPESARPWSGLTARSSGTPEDRLARNLANCGLGFEGWMPCWLPDDMRFSKSDGSGGRTVDLPMLRGDPVGQNARIWDIALGDGDGYWLLASSREGRDDRRTGKRLFRMSEKAGTTLSLVMDPPARLIIAAGKSRCLLLTTAGSVVEAVVMR